MPRRPKCATPAQSLSILSPFAAGPRRHFRMNVGSTTSHAFADIYSLSDAAAGVQNTSMSSQGPRRPKSGLRPTSGPGRSHRKGISFLELVRMFPDDATAEAWFAKQRWPDGQIACIHCGSLNVQIGCAHPSMRYRCRERGCGKRFSTRAGTVMQSSKLSYQVWAIATYLMLTNLKGISSMKLHRELKITQKSAWHLAHRLRAAMTAAEHARFAGPVEADETYVGGKAKNMHLKRRKKLAGADNKVGVLGVRDRSTKKVRVAVMEPDGPSARAFVESSTKSNVMVYTDDSSMYHGLERHETVTHSIGEYVRGQVSTNGLESFWSMFSRGIIGVYHKLSREHMHRYAGEFEGRHNIRDDDTIDQMAATAHGAEGKQVRYRDLVAAGERAARIARGWKPPKRRHRRTE